MTGFILTYDLEKGESTILTDDGSTVRFSRKSIAVRNWSPRARDGATFDVAVSESDPCAVNLLYGCRWKSYGST